MKGNIWLIPYWVCPECERKTSVFLRFEDIDAEKVYTITICRECHTTFSVTFTHEAFQSIIGNVPPIETRN